MLNLDDSITVLKGIGKTTEQLYNKKGIFTLKDMLYYLPTDFRNFKDITKIKNLKQDYNYLLKIKVAGDINKNIIKKNLSIFDFIGFDDSGKLKITFFNQAYLLNKIKSGAELFVWGKMKTGMFNQGYFSAREFYFLPPHNGYLPFYSLTKGLTQNAFRKHITYILKNSGIVENYSEQFLEKFDLMNLKEAIYNIHYPSNLESFIKARSRIVFDELLIFFRILDFLNAKEAKHSDKKIFTGQEILDSFKKRLPYTLTDAQIKTMNEIGKDLSADHFMNRLVQGDVGSGKTVIAFYAMRCMKESGFQSVMMAPTEVLANQHFSNAAKILGEKDIVLLTGSTSSKDRNNIIKRIENGDAKYIIGTHALLYGDINFHSLGLLITDEQHRFGVKQRSELSKRVSDKIHILNMTATPIPRSLALSIYGSTAVSLIDEMPKGRIPIKTYLIYDEKRQKMFDFINDEVKAGRQAYFVCPMIENLDSGLEDTKSAIKMFEEIKQYFRNYNIALLHGRMKTKEKNQIMEDFNEGKIDILVSTTVIEVGVDVPNASVMAIQNADRFGMAQLHQLRGRVGRGSEQSYCFLISDSQNAADRLRFMTRTTDGFEIAKKDMDTRGMGEFLGLRQHGNQALKYADLITDYNEAVKAQKALEQIKTDKDFFYDYNNVNKTALKQLKELNDGVIMN